MKRKPRQIYHAYRGKSRWKHTLPAALLVIVCVLLVLLCAWLVFRQFQ